MGRGGTKRWGWSCLREGEKGRQLALGLIATSASHISSGKMCASMPRYCPMHTCVIWACASAWLRLGLGHSDSRWTVCMHNMICVSSGVQNSVCPILAAHQLVEQQWRVCELQRALSHSRLVEVRSHGLRETHEEMHVTKCSLVHLERL